MSSILGSVPPLSQDASTPQPPPVDASGTLVVLLHGYSHHAADLASIEQEVKRLWLKVRVWRPELPAGIWSLSDPDEIVSSQIQAIDRIIAIARDDGIPVTNIVLVGHSLGALLARKLYVVACGETPDAPFEDIYRRGSPANQRGLIPARPWAQIVTRVILLAGMNRGWRVSHHLSLRRAIQWRAGSVLGYAIHLLIRRWLLIFKIRRGAEFITQLRIQWLQLRRCAGLSDPATGGVRAGNALTVQLLGSRDDMVAPEDNVDLVSGRDFVYLDVPYSGHADVVRFDDSQHGPGRIEVFTQALLQSPEDLQQHASVPSDEKFSEPNARIKNVVFVVHGIRDEGFWTHKIARRVRQRAASRADEWATETSSYGYFPMLPFLFPWYRRGKVEWPLALSGIDPSVLAEIDPSK